MAIEDVGEAFEDGNGSQRGDHRIPSKSATHTTCTRCLPCAREVHLEPELDLPLLGQGEPEDALEAEALLERGEIDEAVPCVVDRAPAHVHTKDATRPRLAQLHRLGRGVICPLLELCLQVVHSWRHLALATIILTEALTFLLVERRARR